jgi:hypothetical protein
MAKEQGFESDEFIEPQIADYDPLMEPVKERSYTKPKVEGGAMLEDLEEPSFAPPSFDDLDAGDAGPQSDAEPASANPYMNDLSGKEKKMASEQLVDAVLTGYEGLHKIANQVVRINPDEIQEMIATGEIDRNLELPLPDGNTMSVPEFVDSFNEQAGEAPQQTPPPAPTPTPPREPDYVVEEPVNFQQEFSEPEEMVRPTRSSGNSNFAAPAPSFDGEPVFGDPKILSNLEKLSTQAPKSKRGRPPKNK